MPTCCTLGDSYRREICSQPSLEGLLTLPALNSYSMVTLSSTCAYSRRPITARIPGATIHMHDTWQSKWPATSQGASAHLSLLLAVEGCDFDLKAPVNCCLHPGFFSCIKPAIFYCRSDSEHFYIQGVETTISPEPAKHLS